jgi:hypothetical protein
MILFRRTAGIPILDQFFSGLSKMAGEIVDTDSDQDERPTSQYKSQSS